MPASTETRARMADGKTAVLASATFVVASGKTSGVLLRLSSLARNMLKQARIVHAQATVRTVGANGAVGAWHGSVSLARRSAA